MRVLSLLLIGLLAGCQSAPTEGPINSWKEEIRQAEAEFAAMADSVGIAEAFQHFAAEDAVLKRGSSLIKGRQSIYDLYTSNPVGGSLQWVPDFVDVSQSGDLGYTYGGFTLTTVDSSGQEITNRGIFHTVWKRQEDGSWKYVWD